MYQCVSNVLSYICVQCINELMHKAQVHTCMYIASFPGPTPSFSMLHAEMLGVRSGDKAIHVHTLL